MCSSVNQAKMEVSRWENFNRENSAPAGNANKTKVLEVPVQRANFGSPCLKFKKKNRWGSGLKAAVRSAAKKLPEYHLPVKNAYLPMAVRAGNVDTLGKWAFGIPGYAGHLVFASFEPEVTIYYPPDSPPELVTMIQKAVEMLK